jgi:hypothetical protein
MTRENDDACMDLVARVEHSETRERSGDSTGQPWISLRSIRATSSLMSSRVDGLRIWPVPLPTLRIDELRTGAQTVVRAVRM